MKSLWPQIGSSDPVEAMMIAIANNRIGEVKRLIRKGVAGHTRGHHVVMWPDDISMFQYACLLGNVEAAQLLYNDRTNLEEPGDTGMTPLMSACAAIKSPDWEADMEEGPQDRAEITRAEKLIRWLVEKGADVNAVRKDDTMAILHWAARGCSYEMVSFLIARGAKVDWPVEDDQPALVLAARANNVPALRALVEHGADINRPCTLPWAEGRTALGVLELESAQDFSKPEAIAYLRSVGAREWATPPPS